MKKAKIFGTLFVLISVTFGAVNTHYLKSILPKIDIDSIDVEIDCKDANEIINSIKNVAPSFGGVI